MSLARLQVDAGDPSALNTLEQGEPYAPNNADQSFWATLLQRANRYDEAIHHYKNALSLTAGTQNHHPVSTFLALGISLQATDQLKYAKLAFNRVNQSNTLSPELAQFTDQHLKQISQLKNRE